MASGEGALRRRVMRSRFRAIREAAPMGSGDRVLEIGCDRGVLLRMLESTGAEVFGVDVNRDAVEAARHPNIALATADRLQFPDGSYTVCVASHVVEHLERPRGLLEEASRVLRDGGSLALVYPWEAFRGMTVIPDVLWRRAPLHKIREYHLHVFTPRSLQALAEGLPLRHRSSRLFLGFPYVFPQYVSVFQRLPR
jgi:SAM-dependent methyltransferase